ncbi:helix-turn-helix domain-containing protein [Streptomyces sp. NPDC058424]|uniref:helix-turn-helix domain-containing protein n=1 Tax=Streptomyces sp. NPDC058424 TaxID=3346491 RepID=UPI0036624999
MTQEDWSMRLGRCIAAEVKRYRHIRGMSAQQLSDACAALGHPIARSVIANFESGRRPTISVAEVLVFARALGVPPVLLLYPLGRVEDVEVLPGNTQRTSAGLDWFTGRSAFPGRYIGFGAVDEVSGLSEWYEDREAGWEAGAAPIRLYQSHHGAVRGWSSAERSVRRMGLAEEHARAELVKVRGRYEGQLREIRSDLRGRGLLLPPLPHELQHIDEDKGNEPSDLEELRATVEELSEGGDE